MRVIVVGNGLAGTIFSKSLRELHREADIDIFTDESWLYYPRPNLIEFLAGSTTQEHLFAFPPEWYRDQNINVRVGTKVVRIDPGSQRVELERGNQERYDVLMLATGARAFLPPFTGAQKKGVFTLRTLEDAQNILAWIADRPRTVVIGGGLLGLEIARALRTRGAKVRVVEFFDRLLPRQLDSQGASLLKNQIENLGIEVRVGVAIEEIMGEKEITGLRFKSGEEWSTDAAIVAAGIRPNIDLAAQAGLETEKGIVVNDYLQTSHPAIYAAGDNVQHRGKIYGIIPACFNQARIAAHNVVGERNAYEGTIPSNTLKVAGIDVTSIGVVNPDEGTCEEFRKEDKEEGIYKKIVIQKGKLVGAIWMGTKAHVNEINRLILQQADVKKHKEALLEEDFDFQSL